jgi:hypothetical protein
MPVLWRIITILALAIAPFGCGRGEPPVVLLSIDEPEEPEPTPSHGFIPPARAERMAAIGPLDGLDGRMRRSFDEEVGYVPTPPPGEGDWLANHRERGQPFESFLRSGANLPSQERTRIYLQPIGAFASEFVVGGDGAVLVPSPPLSQLEEHAELYFDMPVEVLPAVEVRPARARGCLLPDRGHDGGPVSGRELEFRLRLRILE